MAYTTVNTFTQRPSPAQIFAYIVFFSQLVVYYSCILFLFPNLATTLIFTIIYSLTLGGVIVSTLIASIIDPADELMVGFKNGQRSRISSQLPNSFYCDYCRSYVRESSRHCKACNRCVESFDHHCMWINNCVGRKNYNAFAVMIGVTWINLGIYITVTILVSVNFDKWRNELARMIITWIVGALVLVFWFLLTNLIILHIYLACKGLTTYQFILVRRQEQLKEQQQFELNQQKKLKQLKQEAQLKRQPQSSNQINLNDRKTKKLQIMPSSESPVIDDNIFQQKTVKSEQNQHKSQQESHQSQKMRKNDQDEVQSVQISQFFIKNRSLKMIVSDSQANKPNKSYSSVLSQLNNQQIKIQHQKKQQKQKNNI